MAEGKLTEACASFERSYSLRARHGVLLNWAVCLEAKGDRVAAVARFREALQGAEADGRADRAQLAREHLQRLQATLAWLTFETRDAAASELELSCDGATVEVSAEPLPLEPGTHVIRASATGRVPFESTIEATPGTAYAVHIPPLASKESLATRAAPAVLRPAPAPRIEANAPRRRSRSLPPTDAATSHPAVALLAVGLTSVAAGGIFGVRAILDAHEANKVCPDGRCTTDRQWADGQRLEQRGAWEARVADVTLPVGALAIMVGSYLLLKKTPQSQSAAAPVIGCTASGHGLARAAQLKARWAW